MPTNSFHIVGIDIWLGRQGSNLRMLESKSSVLPLDDVPIFIEELKKLTLHQTRSGIIYRLILK